MSDQSQQLAPRGEEHVLQPSAFSAPMPMPGRQRRPRLVLDEVLAEAIDLRPLPEVARRLLAIAEEDDFSLQDLAIVVGADQALTAKILRIANSPFHRHSRQIGTIRDAVILLGFRTVRSAALAACMMQATPPDTNVLDYPEFWRYSVSVGLLAELLAEDEHTRDMAFTAGVMHNLGRLALDQFAPREFARALEAARELGMPLGAAQRELIGFTECELGAALAAHWNYPAELVAAIAAGDLDETALAEAGPLDRLVTQARLTATSVHLGDGLPGTPGLIPAPLPADGAVEPNMPGIARVGGVEELRARVDAFLDGVFPDRQVYSH